MRVVQDRWVGTLSTVYLKNLFIANEVELNTSLMISSRTSLFKSCSLVLVVCLSFKLTLSGWSGSCSAIKCMRC